MQLKNDVLIPVATRAGTMIATFIVTYFGITEPHLVSNVSTFSVAGSLVAVDLVMSALNRRRERDLARKGRL